MPQYGENRVQISYGEQWMQDRKSLAAGAFAANVISTLTGLTANKYDGEEMWCVRGTGAGNKYNVVTNTTTSITCQEVVTTLDATSVVVFSSRTTRPSVSSRFIGIKDDCDYPDEVHDIEEPYYHGVGKDRADAITKAIDMDAAMPVVVQDFNYPFMLFGNEAVIGTDVASGGGSTLNEAAGTFPGETVINLTAATDYAVDDYIQVDVTTLAEVRKITAIATNELTLDYPLRVAHANGVACNEVTAPYTHTITFAEVPLYHCLEGVYDEATDLVRHATGCRMTDGEFKSSTDNFLIFTANTYAMDVLKNDTTKSSVTALTDVPYMFHMVNGGISINGITYAQMLEWSYKVDWKLIKERYHQDVTAKKPWGFRPSARKHVVTAKILGTNDNIRTLCTGETEFTVILNFDRTATSDECTFTFANCRITKCPYNFPIEGPVQVEVEMLAEGLTSLVVIDDSPYYTAG